MTQCDQQKTPDERLDLLIEVTKANTEVTKHFTEIGVRQNQTLKNINENLQKVVDFIEKEEGLPKKIAREKEAMEGILRKSFKIFFLEMSFLIGGIGLIITAIYFWLAQPDMIELKRENQEMNEKIIKQNYEIQNLLKNSR